MLPTRKSQPCDQPHKLSLPKLMADILFFPLTKKKTKWGINRGVIDTARLNMNREDKMDTYGNGLTVHCLCR